MARGNSISKMAVWVLLSLLILGLGGFGVTSLSGGIRSIGKVGDQEIDIDQYARALQEDIRAVEAQTGESLSFVQAQAFGIDRTVLARLVTAAALDNEAAELGLSIGDENLSKQIMEIDAFQGVNGQFDRDGYKFALDRAGLTEAKFEDQLRRETARTLLQGAIVRGTQMPSAYADAVVNFVGETRSFSWIRLDQSHLEAPIPAPTDDQLRSYHQSNLPQFTTPEMKKITFAWLSPEMVLDQIDIDENQLRAEYDARADELNTPERRLVERLAFPDTAAAEAAKAAIETGETEFEALVSDRGLDLSDVDMGDVDQASLGEAGPAVFNADVGGVVGPFETTIGPALFRVNGVLAAQETSFEDAREQLRDDLALDRARRLIDTRVTEIDGLLAGGATLEELQAEIGMQVGQIDWYYDSGEGIASYEAFRKAAVAIKADDYPKVEHLDDGGIFAIRLDETMAPRIQPVEEVREKVAVAWEAAQTDAALLAQAQALIPRLSEGAQMSSVGYDVTEEEDVPRGQFILGTPRDFMDQVFELSKGELRAIEGPGTVIVVRLDSITAPDPADPDMAAIAAQLDAQADASLAQDLFQAYAADIQSRAGIELDQAALNAVHANFQ